MSEPEFTTGPWGCISPGSCCVLANKSGHIIVGITDEKKKLKVVEDGTQSTRFENL